MHEEIKRPASSVRSAEPGHLVFFVNEDGIPSLKDEDGLVLDGQAPRLPLAVNWKNGTAGNPYVDGDTVSNFLVGQMVMCQIPETEEITIEFPPADAESAGREIMIFNLIDKKSVAPGNGIFVPAGSDRIGYGEAGAPISPLPGALAILSFISDGNGWWHVSAIGGDIVMVPPPV